MILAKIPGFREIKWNDSQIETMLARSARKMKKTAFSKASSVTVNNNLPKLERDGVRYSALSRKPRNLDDFLNMPGHTRPPRLDFNNTADAVDKENAGIPGVLYAQKITESILNTEGVQFPSRYVFDSAFHNIADVGLIVKLHAETLQFKDWFKKSKVVKGKMIS